MGKRIHFIAIGGSAMHNLAIALHLQGYQVSGSDDEIFDPARKRLMQYGLFPEQEGWFPDRISEGLDAVILGMHARADNPELVRARQLGLKIFSYPEYLYHQSAQKTRVVIGGSHGKTTITAMILHVLGQCGVDADYMVGAQIEGFDVMVRLGGKDGVMVMEGDEYLSSALDPRPKFHLYKPHIALLTGIAWDHINVFPTFEVYLDQFRKFIHLIEPGGTLLYCKDDALLDSVCREEAGKDLVLLPYSLPDYEIKGNQLICYHNEKPFAVQVFGRHNLLNISGAQLVCKQMGISGERFFQAVSTFKGAGRRLEKVCEQQDLVVFRDFAHAPSKVLATNTAVREWYPGRRLIACVELHTFSSLNASFVQQYRDSLALADDAFIFYSPDALRLKRMPALHETDIVMAFGKPGVRVFTDPRLLKSAITECLITRPAALLMMSSGSFAGLDMNEFCPNREV
jgi:UDP-N-acetylmuramate: L-alanyl-gamma-D-glutamyl-meso-diaminopimelate ligase